ncbi:hypothetical protein [Zhihengliuella halotolerans]|uniref:Uncharacterized protein n=1 Tax=Zhihengliuella halotolerans TaxID=370736 RepID=A0A4Q8AHF1_9MICC|nr:hypothetical protein [Zhihengliuella halotolerans]RZU63193.1 hypothetical protein EV380_2805 [Zhihengliuella halotolerans]
MSGYVADAGVVVAVRRTPSDAPGRGLAQAAIEVTAVPTGEIESERRYVLELFDAYAEFVEAEAGRLRGLMVLFGGHLRTEPEVPLSVAVTSFAIALESLDILLERREEPV